MTIKDVHDIILFFLNKEQNAYLSHEEIDAVLDRAQMSQFNEYYNNHKLYRPDNQVPIVGYGESQRINDALSPFKSTYTFTNADTVGGVVTMPSTYMYLIALYTTQFVNSLNRNVTNPVTVLNEEELIYRLESQVLPVTLDDPICIINANNKIQLFPDQPQAGKVFFFRRPLPPKFEYSQSGRTINWSGGQNLEWREGDINNIIMKALSFYGLNISSQEMVQYAETKNQQGN
jgi:hypothetical protein